MVVQTAAAPAVVQLSQPVPQPQFRDAPVTVIDSDGKQVSQYSGSLVPAFHPRGEVIF